MRVLLITGFALDKRAFDPLRLPMDRFAVFDLLPPLPGEELEISLAALGAADGRPR